MCLGLEISRHISKRTFHLFQINYVSSVLATFGMQHAKPTVTPMEPKLPMIDHTSTTLSHEARNYFPY